MAAKKRKRAPKKEPKFTAVKMVVHQANIVDKKHPGPYRYVISGLLVSDTPLSNIPVDHKGNLVMENVDIGSTGYTAVAMLKASLEGMTTRDAKKQGLSSDQYLLSLQEV